MNSKSGQYNYKGINAQSWAAMSLFLQFVRARTLEKITLEASGLQDFVLVFNDGHRLICESKNYEQPVAHSKIKEILEGVIENKQYTDKDEILIIASKFSKEVKSDIENYKYWARAIKPKLQKKGFQKRHFDLLSQVHLWEVPPVENHKIVYSLFAELLSVWIPQEELEAKVDSLVIKKIYETSAVGGEYSRKELIGEIEKLKENVVKHSGYFDDERVKLESQLANILQAIEDNKRPEWAANQLSSLTAQSNKMFFVVDRFKNRKNLNLSDWNELWESCMVSFYSSYPFDIFENNLKTPNNRKYAVEFISKIIPNISMYYRSRFLEVDIVKVCSEIIKKDKKLNIKVFEVIKQLIEIDKNDFFYVKSRGDREWEKEKICELLKELYEACDKNLKSKIVKLILDFYNLVEDDGKFWHYTPPAIFEIVKQFVEGDVERRILELKEIATRQYSEFYKRFGRKLEFDGWELMGGGISQMGSEFSISDKHFLTKIIRPVLEDYHDKNPEKTWRFIKKNFIARKESQVSKDRPDFLNRAVIGILVKEYTKSKYKSDAFAILSDFIKMRKGIPWKADLVFQAIRSARLKDEDKWALVGVSLKAYKNLPVNVFVEQITSDLASKGHKQAIKTIASWAKNPEYSKRHTVGSFDIVDNVSKLLDNPKTFNEGVKILRDFVISKDFIEKESSWKTWDIAKALARILEKDFDKGLEILSELNSPNKPSLNQQTLICSSLYNLAKDKEKKEEVIKKTYYKFLKPTLYELDNDIKKIEKKFTNRYARESLIQFGEGLALIGLYSEALSLVKIFIKDSDPILENYPDDEEGAVSRHERVKKGEDDFSIGTVRGWCAWVIQKLVIPRDFSKIDKTRQIIKESLPLLKKLTNDPNYYVRVQACIPLIELVKNKHTVLPENRKERFLPMKTAGGIESIAFTMLRNKENHKLKAVMKHLAMVFTYMRSLTEVEAKEVLETFFNTKIDEAIQEIDILYIFFAEFRKNAFRRSNARVVFRGRWSKIKEFDDRDFKKLLKTVLKKGPLNVKAHLAWRFWQLPKESGMDFDKGIKISMSYLPILTQEYSQKVFSNIYYFIKEYLDQKFDECFLLWSKCLTKERLYLREAVKDKDNIPNVHWWPFFYNGRMLLAVAKHKGNVEFLKWFEFLADYPDEVLIANDIGDAVTHLKTLSKSNMLVGEIFDKLIKRNANFLHDKQDWQKQKS